MMRFFSVFFILLLSRITQCLAIENSISSAISVNHPQTVVIDVNHTSINTFQERCYGLLEGYMGRPNAEHFTSFFEAVVQPSGYLGRHQIIVRTSIPEEYVNAYLEFFKEYLDVENLEPKKLVDALEKLPK